MHPHSWPYMFSIYCDPWTPPNGRGYGIERWEDPEYIKQEGISLTILRMINMFDFNIIELVKHMCLRVLLACQDTTSEASSSMHATPNAAQYIEYVAHIYLIAICESNGPKDLQYMVRRCIFFFP